MDMNQVARMIEWLDEERRRDKALIATMEERLAQQQDVIDTLQKRVNSVESDQTVMQTQYMPSNREGEMIDQLRQEMRQLIESTESKRLNAEREAERRANLERQSMSRPVQELQDKVTKLERTTTEMPSLHVERDRLSTSIASLQQRVDDLNKRMEEPDRRLAFLEEQRRQDIRRISEMESDLPEMQKQIDGIRPKMTLLEDLSLRNERRVQEIQEGERLRRDQIQEFIDQQTLQLQQRDQQIENLLNRFGSHDEAIERNMERFEAWEETYRSMKQIVDDFQRIGDRLERRINEVAEMQRLSEERFRQEWNDWRSDDQKRWKQFTLSNDEVWRNHDKDFERFVERLDSLGNSFTPIKEQIEHLWQLQRAHAKLYRETYQELLHEYDTLTPATPIPVNGNGTTNTPPTDN